MQGQNNTPAGPDLRVGPQAAPRQRKVTAKSTSQRLHYQSLRLRWCLWFLRRQCRQAGTRLHANVTQWMYRHTRLRRRLRWCALVCAGDGFPAPGGGISAAGTGESLWRPSLAAVFFADAGGAYPWLLTKTEGRMPAAMPVMRPATRTMTAHHPKRSGQVNHIIYCGVYGSPGVWPWCCG